MDTAANPALPAQSAPGLLVPATPGVVERFMALPMKTRAAFVAGVVAVAVLLGLLVVSTHEGEQRVLFANLDDKRGGEIIARLQQMNVPFKLGDGGVIFVPAARVNELRMKLATEGLSGASEAGGYELLDKLPFGITQLQESTAMQRALEGELARMIAGYEGVKAANVKLGLPPRTGFFREEAKPTASVQVTMRGGRLPDRALLGVIANAVAGSVPGLNPKNVTVSDATGTVSINTDEERSASLGLDKRQLEYVDAIEKNYKRRVVDLLAPMVGADNLVATVTADIDFSQTEATSDEYKPNQGEAPAAVRKQVIDETNQPNATMATGVPGAMANQAPSPATAPVNGAPQQMQAAQAGAGGSSSRRAQTDYEVNRTVRVTRNATGTVRRLSAAVVVNHRVVTDAKGKSASQPLPPEELEKLTALVQQGIGFDTQRGDSVRVINAPFVTDAPRETEAVPLWQQPWLLDLLRSAAAPAALVIATLLVLLMLVRPALKAVLAPPPPPAPAEGDAAVGTQLDAVVDDTPALPAPGMSDMRDDPRLLAARELTKENPVAVANIVRGWVNGEATA